MAFTSISQLTRNKETNSIVNGKGFLKKGHTFFYAEDILKVLNQWKEVENEPEPRLSQLQIVNIVFERKDGAGNHNITEVTGLALAKRDTDDNISDTEWYDKVAISWPPYYKKGSVTTLENDIEGSEFKGHRFEGHDDYTPGFEIHKE